MPNKRELPETHSTDHPAKLKQMTKNEETCGKSVNKLGSVNEPEDKSPDEFEDNPAEDTGSFAHDSDEAVLRKRLAKAIYKGRPSKFKARVIDYLIQIRSTLAPHPDDFIAFLKASHPAVKAAIVIKEWQRAKGFFDGDSRRDYSAIAPLINIPDFVAAFRAAPEFDAEYVGLACMSPLSHSAVARADSQPSSLSFESPGQGAQRCSRSSICSGGSNSSSSSSSSDRHLTPTQIARMQSLYQKNFHQFKGDEWVLPSGVIVDQVLFGIARNMSFESPLHSFVIETPAAPLSLFPDPIDQDELRKALIERVGEELPALSSVEMAFVELFNKAPADLEKLFAHQGWRTVGASLAEKPSDEFQCLVFECMFLLLSVYRGNRMALPQVLSQSFVVHRLWGFLAEALHSSQRIEYQPGEYYSQASVHRRRLDHSCESQQVVGHMVDGAVIAASKNLELLVIKASKNDHGPNVTKAQDDRMELCKLTKDMHDLIRSKAKHDVRGSLATFGIQLSGVTATFFTLRQRRGRFYQLCCEWSESLPYVWTDQTETQSIIDVLTKVLATRKALLSMAKDIGIFTASSHGVSTNSVDCIAATMTSPQLLPSSPPHPVDPLRL
ncbi:hypothetical protein BGW42_002931 [Actinomortierella wolfii]|nr:hypothetical protein BGW42_002931 [Actinomortierella wolfii]